MRDHQPIPLRDFKGLLDRGSDEMVPSSHLITAKNLMYPGKSIRSRYGFVASAFGAVPGIRRIHVYKRIGEADRLLILDTNGNLWDHTNSATPIHSDPDWLDFSCVSMYNRCYLSPHNRFRGLPGDFVYVYQGSGVIRKIAGVPPTGAPTVADSPDAGDVPAGWHAFAVSYLTDTGFVTKPCDAVTFESAGEKKVRLTNIPIGPSYVNSRYILSTHSIIDYDETTFNPNDYEFFFVPDGVLSDNTTTTLDVDFFDTDLVASADYLLDQLAEIPAMLCLADLDSRLAGGGADTEESVLRVSKKTEPESFDAVEGFVLANPGSGGPINAAKSRRGTYYIFKDRRIYLTSDLGTPPVAWPVTELDFGSGTSVFGVGRVLESQGDTEDRFVYADYAGLQLFTGTMMEYPLTWKVDDVWKRINKDAFNTIQVYIDPDRRELFICLPLGVATQPNVILYGDYSEGLTYENIKWSTWEFTSLVPNVIFMNTDNVSKKTIFGFASNSSNNYYLLNGTVESDDGVFKECIIEFPFVGKTDKLGILHYNGIRLRIYGSGTVSMYGQGLDKTVVDTLDSIVLTGTPAAVQLCLSNIISEQVSYKLVSQNINGWFQLDYGAVFLRELWDSR